MTDVLLEWLITTSTTGAYVILPPNSRQVWGYPHKSGQNMKFVPIFLLVTSHFMFLTYQSLKKVGVGEHWEGCMLTKSGPWTIRYRDRYNFGHFDV